MASTPIRVLIAGGWPIVLEGLRSALSRSPDILVVDQAVDSGQTITKTVQLDPDVVLINSDLPSAGGLEVLRHIRMRAPRSKVILFASGERNHKFMEAAKLGCAGILSDDACLSLIAESIRVVYAGEIFLHSNSTTAIMRQLSAEHSQTQARFFRNPRTQLTRRQRDVIALLAQGYKNTQIAEKLFIADQTVKNHLYAIHGKLGISNRLQLALYAVYFGLLEESVSQF